MVRDSHAKRALKAAYRATLVVVGGVALCALPAAAQDTGWVIERIDARYTVSADGLITVDEVIDVDFFRLSRRGILRDIDDLFSYDATSTREYAVVLQAVTSADGGTLQVRAERSGSARRFRIGDPNRTVSGKQAYRIAYTIGGALNGFPDRDELYWNATGEWPVPILKASVVVVGPGEAIDRVACFQGPRGSTESCDARFTPGEAVFTATRTLAPGEQMTIVAGLTKGAVAEPQPILRARRDRGGGAAAVATLLEPTPLVLAFAVFSVLAAIGGAGGLWWRFGRDRRYVSMHHLSGDATEERVPLFDARAPGVEFEPPQKLTPGQMGLLIDERADTLDVTATIIDLAVRGHVKITELEKTWFLGKKDWELDRVGGSTTSLLEYERIVLSGLFGTASTRKLSDLKTKFYKDLEKAKTSLYRDAVDRGWFPRSPASVRMLSRVLGILIGFVGAALMLLLTSTSGAGLAALPVVVFGVLLLFISGAMPRRTAEGRELMLRTLGFEKYVRTAETGPQAYAERANIFTAYLPYAVAFRCVEKWARAFKDIDVQAATAGWYAGTGGFDPASFSSSLGSFSGSVSTAIASTPGGSGSSGFSGGSSGGGGGGGGGGSW